MVAGRRRFCFFRYWQDKGVRGGGNARYLVVLSRIWTVRIVLAALTLEVGFICSFFSGDIAFLRRSEEGLFRTCLSWVREVNPAEVILETEIDADNWRVHGWSLRTLGSGEVSPAVWSFVEVPFSRELFDGKEPKPSEYAILLAKLHQAGVRKLALTQSLSWSEIAELELRALDGSLRPFGDVLLPIALSEVPQPASSPFWLEGSLLSSETLRGDASALPLMNQVITPPSVSVRPGLRFAFPDFGSRDLQYRVPGRLPVVTRWGDEYLPSWSLGLAMQMEGVELDELMIEPGRHLRIGPDGPVIPLDDFGRAKLEEAEKGEDFSEMITAQSLFALEEEDALGLKKGVVLFEALDRKTMLKSRELVTAALRLREFPRPGKAEKFRRLDFKWEVFIYCEIVLGAIFALYLKPFPQLIAWAVLGGGLFFFALGLLNWKGVWTPLLPIILAMVVSWCLVGYLQQIAYPMRLKKKKS